MDLMESSVGKGRVTRRQGKWKMEKEEDCGEKPGCNEEQRTKVDDGS